LAAGQTTFLIISISWSNLRLKSSCSAWICCYVTSIIFPNSFSTAHSQTRSARVWYRLKHHKVVDEQLHLTTIMCPSQILKKPLQLVALDIALGAGTVKSLVQNSEHTSSSTRTWGSIYLYR
jgi:hypothetical protein